MANVSTQMRLSDPRTNITFSARFRRPRCDPDVTPIPTSSGYDRFLTFENPAQVQTASFGDFNNLEYAAQAYRLIEIGGRIVRLGRIAGSGGSLLKVALPWIAGVQSLYSPSSSPLR